MLKRFGAIGLRGVAVATALVLLAGQALPSGRTDLAFLENHSRPTQCAEDGNVVYTLSNPEVGRFEIDVSAPVYLPDLKAEAAPADAVDCPLRPPADGPPREPVKETLYESDDVRVVGEARGDASRGSSARVVIGRDGRSGIRLVRWMRKVEGEFYEILLVDLAEGSWRVRPVPKEAIPNAAYGTVFFVGPAERLSAPSVAIETLKIDPAAGALRMAFAKGGVAELKISKADRTGILLQATVDGLPRTTPAQPFAAIRSMYVWPTKAHVARVNWTTASGVYNQPVMEFRSGYASEVRFDRIEVSRLSAAAPDVTFRRFQEAPKAGR